MTSQWEKIQRYFQYLILLLNERNGPPASKLKEWCTSEWLEYQAWIFHHDLLTKEKWQILRHESLLWADKPLISIVVPVYNTNTAYLHECIQSVLYQTYPKWELCLVDDASSDPNVIKCLKHYASLDRRIKMGVHSQNSGICQTTNKALKMCSGDYIAFLDHDDRLSPMALHYMADAIRSAPSPELIYSNSDMLSPRGLRYMHMFKPPYSPEFLLSFNYIGHLTVLSRSLIRQLGGVRPAFEGSQDYDLLLRAVEKANKIQHVNRILYHWRQSPQSIAQDHSSKKYVWDSGVRALNEAMGRRGLKGSVSEISDLWRGNYQIRLIPPNQDRFRTIVIQVPPESDGFARALSEQINTATDVEFIVCYGSGLTPQSPEAIHELISWFQIQEIGFVTGQIIDKNQKLQHAGLVQRMDKAPFSIYGGSHKDVRSYLASTAVVRNVSVPHPGCFAMRRSIWMELQGLDATFQGPFALLDLAMRSLNIGYRTVYTPFACFHCDNKSWEPQAWSEKDLHYYLKKWKDPLAKGDSFYNTYLTTDNVDMGLNCNI